MSWVDDALPLPVARPVEADEALEAAMHALAALAAGVAAIQLMSAVVFRELLPAAFFATALVATGACGFVGESTSFRRGAFLLGGSATALVWLTVLPQAQGQSAVVVLGMAAVSAALTRTWLSRTAAHTPPVVSDASHGPRSPGWIEDDREGTLTGRLPQMEPKTSDREGSTGRLRLYNVGMGALHAIQGIAVLFLSNDFALPVTAAFMEGPPGTPADTKEVLALALGPAVAAFLFISAAAHLIIAGPAWAWYRRNLLEKRSYARWIEYSLSSSLMIVLIAMITGIADVAALIALFGVNASMILFGLLQEHYERPGRPGWLPFVFGCIAGAVPWLAIGVYLWAPGSSAEPPAFVYGIFVSLFVFFNSFALNMVLQYREVGPWRSYLFGEYVYVALSLVAKSALAWQVFANTLVPN